MAAHDRSVNDDRRTPVPVRPSGLWLVAALACAIIAFNGIRLLRPALSEVMDAAVEAETQTRIRVIAGGVVGVAAIEKCRVRKSGLGLCMDIHVEVDGHMTVSEGHEIAHRVKDALTASELRIADVVVHIEPSRPVQKQNTTSA